MNRQEAEIKLKQIFSLDHFYDEQWQAIERILRGERILMIERTGFGKSLCYQFPATQFPGVTVVFSPLIALMCDQVRSLCKKGIPAAHINSEQSYEDNQESIQHALAGEIKILYKGSTWNGVIDGLRKGRPIFVRYPEKPQKNANLLLIQKGASAIDLNGMVLKLDSEAQKTPGQRLKGKTSLDLFSKIEDY